MCAAPAYPALGLGAPRAHRERIAAAALGVCAVVEVAQHTGVRADRARRDDRAARDERVG